MREGKKMDSVALLKAEGFSNAEHETEPLLSFR
jgi:hypothetical protein